MSTEGRPRRDTLPMLTNGRSSAQSWLDYINQMGDVDLLLVIARELNKREDAVLPPADGRAVEMGYSREDLIEYALKKITETSVSSPLKLLKRFIPFKAYEFKAKFIDEIIDKLLCSKDDQTVTNLLALAEFLADNPGYLLIEVQFRKIKEIINRLQSLEGVAVISGEIRGNVERAS